MALLPRTPDGWLDDSLALNHPEGEVLSQGVTSAAGSRGILAAANEVRSPTSGLTLLMEPHEIASVPGLPQHVYDSFNDPAPSTGPSALIPASYVSPKHDSADGQERADKLERGANAAGILGYVKDGWNAGNHAVDKVLKSGMAETLGRIADKSDYTIAPIANGLGAAAEIAKGAPIGTAVAGAGIKTASDIGAGTLGGAVGFSLGGPIGAVVGGVAGGALSDYMLGPNKQKIGENAQRVLNNAGQSYSRGVLNNPYYDPRLAAMP